ncbi:uncharacterized protein LOC131926912 [Physella acuta]|uniref:uncharacterized protein LOC131926912 n=1 Tax=Physella acuta TaxID=109671 RepID=UPI0027DB8ECB|nr:uncharacterized protein LOC131926912 [Physella acuta]
MANKKIPTKGGAIASLVKGLHSDTNKLANAFNNRKEVDDARAVLAPANKHIFISYCHKDKDTVHKIYRSLKAAGYEVWIDINNMGGNLLEGMALAVEDSWVVLFCMSKHYKDSPNCRTEAEYTFQQHKEYIILRMTSSFVPDGWLGMLLGARLYYDFSGSIPYGEIFRKLQDELKAVNERVLGRKNISKQPLTARR